MLRWIPHNNNRDTGKYLYKFLSEEHLRKFLDTGNLWFARADKFGDKMECIMVQDLQRDRFDYNTILTRKMRHLISCFHAGDYESVALWDTYAKSDSQRRRYALRFNKHSLTDLII